MRLWAKHPEAAPELVANGWWEDDGNAYVIVHHGVYQRPRDAVLAQQKASRENGQKGGRPPGPPREQAPRNRPPETQSLTQLGSESERGGNLFANPVANLGGQDRPGQEQNWGTSPSEADENDDDVYAEDLRKWCAEDEPSDSAVENVQSVLGARVIGDTRRGR